MEQKTTTKLTIGSFFVIFLMIIYFGNLGSTKVNKKLDLTNQKIEKLITEMHEMKSKLDELEKTSLISESNDTQQLSISTPQKQITSNTIYEDEAQIVNPQPETKIENSLVGVPVVEKERVECCEGDEWAEIQQQRIREVINTEIAVDTDLTINSIECENLLCEIDLTIHDKTGVPKVAKTMNKLSPKDDEENFIDLKNLKVTNAGVRAQMRLLKKEKFITHE